MEHGGGPVGFWGPGPWCEPTDDVWGDWGRDNAPFSPELHPGSVPSPPDSHSGCSVGRSRWQAVCQTSSSLGSFPSPVVPGRGECGRAATTTSSARRGRMRPAAPTPGTAPAHGSSSLRASSCLIKAHAPRRSLAAPQVSWHAWPRGRDTGACREVGCVSLGCRCVPGGLRVTRSQPARPPLQQFGRREGGSAVITAELEWASGIGTGRWALPPCCHS